MDATAYIAEQIPLLTSLHAQLALPPTALADDTARIDAAVRAAIVSVVRSREDEVAQWENKIADGKRALASLARAVGERGRALVNANRRESDVAEPLPAQHERLIRQTEELEQVYNERLAQIEQLQATVERLSVLLGPPFESPAPLHPIPGAAVPARAPRPSVAPTQPTLTAPTINKRHSGRRASVLPVEEQKPETWLDVGEDVVEALQGAMDRALAERDARLRALETTFNDLIWYRAELDLPSPADAQFTSDLCPPNTLEEVPGAHARYESLLDAVVALNPVVVGEDAEEDREIQGMDEVEPEVGLIAWADALLQLWYDEKVARDNEIQSLFERIEPLWERLEVPQDYIDLFIDSNRGSGLASIRAYEEELERVLEIRRTSLSSFVINVRKEIATLQDMLLLSDDEKAEFGAFIDDEYTEDLLAAHEAEAARLRAEVELMSPHLQRVKDWIQLKADEEELERNATDPNRFKKRGNAMLKEARMRTRVEKTKPKIEAELLASLPLWEEEHGRPFLALGERVVETIEAALAAKEAAKEAKRLAKLGLAPGHAGTKAGRATPAAQGRSAPGTARSQPGTSRKREAPTPCPGASALKRPRAGPSSSTRVVSGSSSRSVSGSTARSVSGSSTRSASSSAQARAPLNGTRRADPHATPTPATAAARRFGAPAAARVNRLPAMKEDVFKTPGAGASERPRGPRKSFRPRQSIAGGLLAAGRYGVPPSEDLLDGDEYGDEDVF